MNPQQFGAFIAEERKAKQLTQKELAGKLGVTDQAVSKWERGLCLPDVSKFDDIAAALDLTDIEVLRAHRLPPEAVKEDAPPLVTRQELGRVLLACFLVTLLCFVCQILEDWNAMPFHLYGLARLLQIVFCAAASVWLALRAAGNETRSDYRGALRYALILAAVAAAAVLVNLIFFHGNMGNMLYYFWNIPMKLFGVSGWIDEIEMYQYDVWYQEFCSGIWTPKRLLFFYLSFEIFDNPNLQGLLLSFALYPFVKLLRIRHNGKRERIDTLPKE